MELENIQIALMEPELFPLTEIYGVTKKHLYNYLWVNKSSGKIHAGKHRLIEECGRGSIHNPKAICKEFNPLLNK